MGTGRRHKDDYGRRQKKGSSAQLEERTQLPAESERAEALIGTAQSALFAIAAQAYVDQDMLVIMADPTDPEGVVLSSVREINDALQAAGIDKKFDRLVRGEVKLPFAKFQTACDHLGIKYSVDSNGDITLEIQKKDAASKSDETSEPARVRQIGPGESGERAGNSNHPLIKHYKPGGKEP